MDKTSFLANMGGVFIYSANPKKLAEWYEKVFGFKCEGGGSSYYVSFPYFEKKEDGSFKERYFAWAVLKAKGETPHRDTNKAFRTNYRVKDMDSLVAHLKNLGLDIKGPENYPEEGIFAWLEDPEGNSIELWQDID